MKQLSLIALLLMTSAANAAPLDITDAWFRALPGKLPAGGYFTAQNNTRRDIAIAGASSDACGMLMIHQSSNKGGMSGMDMVEKVTVPAGAKVAFAPGGYHLMCESPTLKMKIGARVPVLLNLSDGTAVAVAFAVKGATGK
ncbi:MAG TPA: copper chaperone PCu(A)C [Rhizomicrobium sp.]|nr:copper chaperone PCu(A)C [Rhizomicrobium sp.]